MLALLLLPIWAAAVVFEPLSIESLTAQADVILHGTVLSKTCQQDSSGRIYTGIELQVIDVWKGAISGSPFRVVHGGGILGERRSTVSGQVDYQLGTEVVAFLVRNSRGEGVTLGLMQGKFEVWKDSVTGAKLVFSPFHGVPEKAAHTTQPRAMQINPGVPPLLTLADLKKRVTEAVR